MDLLFCCSISALLYLVYLFMALICFNFYINEISRMEMMR